MGAQSSHLPGSQHGRKRNLPYFYGRYRHHIASHHACWLASHTPSQWYHFWHGGPPLETGLLPVLTLMRLSRSIYLFCFHKGVIWASLSAVADVPPAVSLVNFKPFSFSVDFMDILGVGFHECGL
jgi:hypothetical protein